MRDVAYGLLSFGLTIGAGAAALFWMVMHPIKKR